MNEVSCRAVQSFLPGLEARGISLEQLVEGLPVSAEHLRNASRRVDWDTNVRLLERIADLVGPDCFAELIVAALQGPVFRSFRLFGVSVADTRYLYRMVCRWIGPSLFTNVRFDYAELPDGRMQIEMEISEGYQGSLHFFRIYDAGLRALPHILGQGDASVEAEISPQRARFFIRAPRRARLVAWLRGLLRLPDATRAAVEEVASQHHALNQALEQVRNEHAELRTQVEQIATLDRLGNTLTRQLGSEQLPERILEFLTQRFGWRGASLFMKGSEDGAVLFFGRSGRTQGEASSSHPLVFGGQPLGRLEVWRDQPEPDADRELLQRLLPWIAMTVTNARFAAGDTGTGLRWASKSGRDLFMILDQNARILYAGPHVDEVLGYESDDLMQMDVTDLVHPDDWPQLADDFSSLARHTSSAIYSSARVQNRDGEFQRMEGVAIKVMSEAGAGVYLISCGDAGERSAAH